jgi:hypothetical protein
MTTGMTLGLMVAGLLAVAPVTAGDGDVRVNTAQNGLTASLDVEHTGETSAPTEASDVDVVDVGTEVLENFCTGTNFTASCEPDEGEPEPELTPGVVASAFARIPLPPSKLIIQPPNGRTLVNFETNFYTESEPFTRSVTLLGQRVQLEITPASFGWRFGDGGSAATSSPGSAYPDLEITHTYLRKGRVSPSVDTTYTATYRVNGGPAQAVPGSVTIPGATVSLRVVTASPQLVG